MLKTLPAFEPVRGTPPAQWRESRGLDWLLTFSIDFDVVWQHAKNAFIEMAYSRSGVAEGDSLAYELVATAHDRLQTPGWEWDEITGIAVVKAADKLSKFREDYNLVLDCIALGYWVRKAERDLTDGFNTFDDAYVEQIREKFADDDQPDVIISIAMNQVRESLPQPFAPGPKIWGEVLEIAVPLLQQRGEVILTETPNFDEDFDIAEERREFTFGLGYGLGVAVEALGRDGTRPKQQA